MAEALYPVEPPPSYESQFLEFKGHRKDYSPLPSAPPLHYPRMNRPKPRSRSDPHAPSLAHLATMNKQRHATALDTADKKTSSIAADTEKENLSPKSPQKRVPKRLPPPPPINGKTVRPLAKSGNKQTAALSKLAMSTASSRFPQGRNFNGSPLNAQADFRGNFSRESSVSASMYDIADQAQIEDACRPLSAMLSAQNLPSSHAYESIDNFYRPQNPLESCREEGGERLLYAVPMHRHLAAQFTRQASAPANIHFRQQQQESSLTDSLGGVTYSTRVSLPEEQLERGLPAQYLARQRHSQFSPPVHSYIVDPHLANQMAPAIEAQGKSLYGRPIRVIPESLPSSGMDSVWTNGLGQDATEVDSNSPQVVPMSSTIQVLPGLSLSMQQADSAASSYSTPYQSTSMASPSQVVSQATDYRPMPKPRSLPQTANAPLATVPAITEKQLQQHDSQQHPPQHVPMSLSYNASLPLQQQQSVITTQQQSQQQQLKQQQQQVVAPANQVLAAVPGVSQLHTYSYTQQSSMVTIPELLSQQQLGQQQQQQQQQQPQQQLQQQHSLASSSTTQPQVVLGMPHSLSSPLIASIPAGMPSVVGVPTQLNVQLVSQTSTTSQAAGQIPEESLGKHQQQAPAENVTTPSMEASSSCLAAPNLDSEPKNGNQHLKTQNSDVTDASLATQTLQVPTSPQREPRRPVPIPRKRISVLDGDQGTASDGEAGSSGRSFSEQAADATDNEHDNAEEAAPAKPPRRFGRKPAPPPPISGAHTSGQREGEGSDPQLIEEPPTPAAASDTIETELRDPAMPTGYRIRDIFSNGNVITLLPLSDPLRLPVRASSSSVSGRGAFKNDCKFEVVFLSSAMGHEQTVLVVMLKSCSRINRYLTISTKGKIKMSKGATEKGKFIVRQVSERPLIRYGVVTLESAIHPEWFVSLSAKGRPRNCRTPRTPLRLDESRFAVRTERIFNAYSTPIRCFGKPSIMNEVRDRQIIQLQCIATEKYLCLTMKGKLKDTGNKGDVATHFMFFDRGMGVVSLRSSKNTKYWLRVKEGRVQGNGKPDLATDFRLLETPHRTVRFESIIAPGIFLHPPCDCTDAETAYKDFKLIAK